MSKEKLGWMYDGTDSALSREEYLLGKKVDRTFDDGGKGAVYKIEHEILPASVARRDVGAMQVDLARKVQEDPLFQIRKQEDQAYRMMMDNPLKRKQLDKVQKRSSSKSSRNKKRSDDDLDKELLKKMALLIGNNSNLGGTSTSEQPRTERREKRKSKMKSKGRSHSRSSSEERSSSKMDRKRKRRSHSRRSSKERFTGKMEGKQKKRRHSRSLSKERSSGKMERKPHSTKRVRTLSGDDRSESHRVRNKGVDDWKFRREMTGGTDERGSDRSEDGHNGRSGLARGVGNTRRWRNRADDDEGSAHWKASADVRSDERDRSTDNARSRLAGNRRIDRSEDVRHRYPDVDSGKWGRGAGNRSGDTTGDPSDRRGEGLRGPDGSKCGRGLADSDAEAKRREMLTNASWQEERRARNVARHQLQVSREEESARSAGQKAQFVNQHLRAATETSTVAQRIRSNRNTIQRSSAADFLKR